MLNLEKKIHYLDKNGLQELLMRLTKCSNLVNK